MEPDGVYVCTACGDVVSEEDSFMATVFMGVHDLPENIVIHSVGAFVCGPLEWTECIEVD